MTRAKCCVILVAYICIILLLTSIIIFVIVPVAFKYSIEIQRNIVFPTWYVEPKNYSNIPKYSLKGVRNFYMTVNEEKNITLGLLQILPNDVLSEFIKNDDYDYESVLKNPRYNVLLYFHGNGQDRLSSYRTYGILRQFFNIIACDYRGYADSSEAELTEEGLIEDSVALYKRLRNITKAQIFLWGHSLGTGVAVHTAAVLKTQNIVPAGVMLEAPFTSVTDVMQDYPPLKFFTWLPWFRYTIIQPMIDNKFDFNTQDYIVDVDCPIMIIHAKDDEIIPYYFATKLYNIAVSNRNYTYQGEVTFHLLDEAGYGHEFISDEPRLSDFVSDFVTYAIEFGKNHTSQANGTIMKGQ